MAAQYKSFRNTHTNSHLFYHNLEYIFYKFNKVTKWFDINKLKKREIIGACKRDKHENKSFFFSSSFCCFIFRIETILPFCFFLLLLCSFFLGLASVWIFLTPLGSRTLRERWNISVACSSVETFISSIYLWIFSVRFYIRRFSGGSRRARR